MAANVDYRQAEAGSRDGELLAALVERLRGEGAPGGLWLVDIARARQALRGADDLLRRMEHAIITDLPALDEFAPASPSAEGGQ